MKNFINFKTYNINKVKKCNLRIDPEWIRKPEETKKC